MMKQTLIIALALSSMAFAQKAADLKAKDLGKIGRESKETQAKTTAVVEASSVAKRAEVLAAKIGGDASGVEKMITKVPQMEQVINNVIAKGDQEAMKMIAKSTRNSGTDADAALDNAGVKKVMLNADKMEETFGKNGLVIKAEMAASTKPNNLALRDALAKTKGIEAKSKEMDKTVREELPVCE